MKGFVIQFRRGRRVYTPRHFIVDAGLSSRKEATQLIGKEVEWKNPISKKIIKGKIKNSRLATRSAYRKHHPCRSIGSF